MFNTPLNSCVCGLPLNEHGYISFNLYLVSVLFLLIKQCVKVLVMVF